MLTGQWRSLLPSGLFAALRKAIEVTATKGSFFYFENEWKTTTPNLIIVQKRASKPNVLLALLIKDKMTNLPK